jgi:hypothetical protein
MIMLKCERNTRSMERRVLSSWRRNATQDVIKRTSRAVFEHGQWWILCEDREDNTRTFSVCDASPGDFIFEEC